MTITKSKGQVNILFGNNNSMHLYAKYKGIMTIGITYDSWKPFRNISIELWFIGIALFF